MPSFSLQIAAWVNKVGGDVDKVTRYCLQAVDGRLGQRSPVGDAKYWLHKAPKGYAGGRFKGNWQMSVGAPAAGVLNVSDPGGQATLASHAGVVAAARAGQVFYLMNNLPYAKRIEEGWSRQAPVGVVALTVVEWSNIVDAAVNGVRSGTSATDFSQGYQTYSL
jgi:hypothetical protein